MPDITPPKVEYDPSLKDAFIFDIDGTLAKMNDRSPYEYDKAHTDSLIEDVALLNEILGRDYVIFIVSGREDTCMLLTHEWLMDKGVTYNHLHMRKNGDHRKDSIVKKEIYEEHIKGKYNVLGVFDDRNQVVELWRSLGLTCYQVADGNF